MNAKHTPGPGIGSTGHLLRNAADHTRKIESINADLLAACKAVVKAYREDYINDTDSWVSACEDAIAKAEGRES